MAEKRHASRFVNNSEQINKATLRLFTAIQVDKKHRHAGLHSFSEQTIRHGYILEPSIQADDALLRVIEGTVGISGEKANSAFHKSWSVIRDSSMESLVIQQIVHYFTTYGFESLGIYQKDAVYIPKEKLELPLLEDNIPLIVIKALDAQEILERIIGLGSGVALAQETLDDIMTVIQANAYDSAFVSNIRNRELTALLYDFYNIVPSEPVEFLRHLVSKLTDEPLLIKNNALIEKRVDLDLSALSETGKIGWDAEYRSGDLNVLFSGDMTDAPAPDGASELFYFKNSGQKVMVLMVNYYNFNKGDKVESKLLVAHEKPERFHENYMVDPNKILASANISVTQKQNIFGLLANVNGENRIYFAKISIGTSITVSNNEFSAHARRYLIDSLMNSLDLRTILKMAGATVVDEKPDNDYQDLSPEAFDKTTIIDLLSKQA